MSEKIYYKIGDVSSRFDVNASLLRYWESEFGFIAPRKNNKGTRYYNKKDIDNIEIVHHLIKEKGMTIQGAKDFLENRKEENSLDKLEVIVTLKRTRELLSDIKAILDKKSLIE